MHRSGLVAEHGFPNSFEQPDQLSSLIRIQRGHDLLTSLALKRLPLVDVCRAGRRQLDQRGATIARCGAARQEPLPFQHIHRGGSLRIMVRYGTVPG